MVPPALRQRQPHQGLIAGQQRGWGVGSIALVEQIRCHHEYRFLGGSSDDGIVVRRSQLVVAFGGLASGFGMLYYNPMHLRLADPLAPTASLAARLVLAVGLAAVIWLIVLWAL